MASICAHKTNQESCFVDSFGYIKEERVRKTICAFVWFLCQVFIFTWLLLFLQEQEEEAPRSGNSEKEVPESSNKSESETAHQRYLGKGKAAVIDSSSPQQYQGVHVDPRRRLEFDIDSLLKQVSDLKYQALNLITQAGGGRFQDLDVTSQADGARAQAPDLTSQISGARSQSSKAKSKAPIHYEVMAFF